MLRPVAQALLLLLLLYRAWHQRRCFGPTRQEDDVTPALLLQAPCGECAAPPEDSPALAFLSHHVQAVTRLQTPSFPLRPTTATKTRVCCTKVFT